MESLTTCPPNLMDSMTTSLVLEYGIPNSVRSSSARCDTLYDTRGGYASAATCP